MGNIVSTVAQKAFDLAVHCTATFLAAVLSHPAMQEAQATVIMKGSNKFITQPDLNQHLKIMSETLAKNQEESARNAGEDFPKLLGHFVAGMFSPRKDKQKDKHDNKLTILTNPSEDSAMTESTKDDGNKEGAEPSKEDITVPDLMKRRSSTPEPTKRMQTPPASPLDSILRIRHNLSMTNLSMTNLSKKGE